MRSGVVLDLDETLLDRRATIMSYANRFWSDFERHIRVPKAEFLERFLALDDNGCADRRRFYRDLAGYLDSPALAEAQIAGHFVELAWSAPELVAGAEAGCRRLRAAGIVIRRPSAAWPRRST